MCAVLLIGWYGVHKQLTYLLVPALTIVAYLAYDMSTDVQARVAPEMRVFVEGERTEEALDGVGTGRFAAWRLLWADYVELEDAKQVFGTGRDYGAHNQWIAYLMKAGVLGVTCFCIMLYSVFRALRREYRKTRRPEIAMALTLWAALSFQGITGHPFDWTTVYWYGLITVSFVNADRPPGVGSRRG